VLEPVLQGVSMVPHCLGGVRVSGSVASVVVSSWLRGFAGRWAHTLRRVSFIQHTTWCTYSSHWTATGPGCPSMSVTPRPGLGPQSSVAKCAVHMPILLAGHAQHRCLAFCCSCLYCVGCATAAPRAVHLPLISCRAWSHHWTSESPWLQGKMGLARSLVVAGGSVES
jgi:hypothetical protein